MGTARRKISLESIRTHTPGILPYIPTNVSRKVDDSLVYVTSADTNGNWGEIPADISIYNISTNRVIWKGSANGLLDIYFQVRNICRSGLKLYGISGTKHFFKRTEPKTPVRWYDFSFYESSEFSINKKGNYYRIDGSAAATSAVTLLDSLDTLKDLLSFEPEYTLEDDIKELVYQVQRCVGIYEVPSDITGDKVPEYLYYVQIPAWISWFQSHEQAFMGGDCCVVKEWHRRGSYPMKYALEDWYNSEGQNIFSNTKTYIERNNPNTRVVIESTEPTLLLPLSLVNNTCEAGVMTPYDESAEVTASTLGGLMVSKTIETVLSSRLDELRSKRRAYDNSGEVLPYIFDSAKRMVIPYERIVPDEMGNVFNSYVDSDGTYVADYIESIEYLSGGTPVDISSLSPNDTNITARITYVIGGNPKQKDNLMPEECNFIIDGQGGEFDYEVIFDYTGGTESINFNPSCVWNAYVVFSDGDEYLQVKLLSDKETEGFGENEYTENDFIVRGVAFTGETIDIEINTNTKWAITHIDGTSSKIQGGDASAYLGIVVPMNNGVTNEYTVVIKYGSTLARSIEITLYQVNASLITTSDANKYIVDYSGRRWFYITGSSVSCSDYYKSSNEDGISAYIYVTAETIENKTTGEVRTGSSDWRAHSTANWCVLEDRITNSTPNMLKFKVEENKTLLPRECTVEITYAGIASAITVYQCPASSLKINIGVKNEEGLWSFADKDIETTEPEKLDIAIINIKEDEYGAYTEEDVTTDYYITKTEFLVDETEVVDGEEKKVPKNYYTSVTEDDETRLLIRKPAVAPDAPIDYAIVTDYVGDEPAEKNSNDKHLFISNIGPGGINGHFELTTTGVTDPFVEKVVSTQASLDETCLNTMKETTTVVGKSPIITFNKPGEVLYVSEWNDDSESAKTQTQLAEEDAAYFENNENRYLNPEEGIELSVYTTAEDGWTSEIEWKWFSVPQSAITVGYKGGSNEIQVNSSDEWNVTKKFYAPVLSPDGIGDYCLVPPSVFDAKYNEVYGNLSTISQRFPNAVFDEENQHYIYTTFEKAEADGFPEVIHINHCTDYYGPYMGYWCRNRVIKEGDEIVVKITETEYNNSPSSSRVDELDSFLGYGAIFTNGKSYLHYNDWMQDPTLTNGEPVFKSMPFLKKVNFEEWLNLSSSTGSTGESTTLTLCSENNSVSERTCVLRFTSNDTFQWFDENGGEKEYPIYFDVVVTQQGVDESIIDFSPEKTSIIKIVPTFDKTRYKSSENPEPEIEEVENVNYLQFKPSGGYKVATLYTSGVTYWTTNIEYTTPGSGTGWCEIIPGAGVAMKKPSDSQHIAVMCHEYTALTEVNLTEGQTLADWIKENRRRALVTFTNVANPSNKTVLEVYQEPPVFLVDPQLPNNPVGMDGGFNVLGSVNTNLAWETSFEKVEGDEPDNDPSDWLTVLPESGFGDVQPQVQVAKNNTSEARQGKIVISVFTDPSKYGENNGYGSNPIYITQSAFTISQEAGIYLNVWKNHVGEENVDGKLYEYPLPAISEGLEAETNHSTGWVSNITPATIKIDGVGPTWFDVSFAPVPNAVGYTLYVYSGETKVDIKSYAAADVSDWVSYQITGFTGTKFTKNTIYTMGLSATTTNPDVPSIYVEITDKTLKPLDRPELEIYIPVGQTQVTVNVTNYDPELVSGYDFYISSTFNPILGPDGSFEKSGTTTTSSCTITGLELQTSYLVYAIAKAKKNGDKYTTAFCDSERPTDIHDTTIAQFTTGDPYKLFFTGDTKLSLQTGYGAVDGTRGSLTMRWNVCNKASSGVSGEDSYVEVNYAAQKYYLYTGTSQGECNVKVGEYTTQEGTFAHDIPKDTYIWVGIVAVPGGTENNGIYFDTPNYYIPSDMVSIRVKVPDKPLLNTPNVSGVTSTTHSVSFAWDIIQGASSYEYRLYKEGGDDIIDSGITTQRTYTSQYVLSATTLYKLMVKAISGDDAHADSLFGSATIETKEEYFYVYKPNEAATTSHDTVATAAYDFVSGSSLTDRRKPLVVDSTPLEGWRAVIEYDDWKYYLVRPIITVNSKTTNSITISWSSAIYNSDVVSGTITYYVEAYLGETQVFSGTASTLTKQITGLTPGTTYAIKVIAKSSDEHVIQSESEVSSVKTKTILATPTGLTASGVTTTTERVQWSQVANASSYDVYWYIGTVGNGSYVGSGSTTSTSYNIAGLTKNTNYYFKVKANGSGDFVDSDWSDYCGFTTLNSIKITGVSFTYTSTTSTSARFDWSWDDNEMKTHCNGYVFYSGVSENNVTDQCGISNNKNQTSYTLTNLTPGSTIYFGVVATTSESDYENSEKITISATLEKVKLATPQVTSTINENQVTFTWQSVANAWNYVYRYSINNTEFVTGTVSDLSFVINELTEGDIIVFYLKAVPASNSTYYTASDEAEVNVTIGNRAKLISISKVNFAPRFTLQMPVAGSPYHEYALNLRTENSLATTEYTDGVNWDFDNMDTYVGTVSGTKTGFTITYDIAKLEEMSDVEEFTISGTPYNSQMGNGDTKVFDITVGTLNVPLSNLIIRNIDNLNTDINDNYIRFNEGVLNNNKSGAKVMVGWSTNFYGVSGTSKERHTEKITINRQYDSTNYNDNINNWVEN